MRHNKSGGRVTGSGMPPTPRGHNGLQGAVEQRARAEHTRGRRAMRHAGRGARFMAIALIPFGVMLILGLGLTIVRLKHGPISLSFLVPPIERSINAVLDGYEARVEDAIVQLTDNNRLEFRLQNVRFAEADGDLVASSPLASIEVSRKALMQGRLLPSRVELIRPELFLTYTPANGLALSFSAPRDVVTQPEGGGATLPAAPEGSGSSTGAIMAAKPGAAAPESRELALLKKIEFGQLLSRASSETRDPDRAASFLREFGVTDAILHVESQGHRTVWQLPEAGIDLDNRDTRSIISGRARVASGIESWSVVFHTEEENGQLTVRASVRDLVPAALMQRGAGGTLLSFLDLPVGADITVALASSGEARAVDLDVGLGRGKILVRNTAGQLDSLPFEAGRVKFAYDPATGAATIAPSTLHAGDMKLSLTGTAHWATFDDGAGWNYEINSSEGLLGAVGAAVPPVPLTRLVARGRLLPSAERLLIDAAEVDAGEAKITASADVSLSALKPGARFKASATPMSVETLKAIWPVGLAAKTRAWVAQNVLTGKIERFDVLRESGQYAVDGAAPTGVRSSLVVEASAGSFRPVASLPPISFPRALVGIENGRLEISVPDALVGLASGRTITLKGGQLVAEDVAKDAPLAEISFKAQTDVTSVIEFVRAPPLSMLGETLPFKSADGKVEAQLALSLPLQSSLEISGIKPRGKAKLTDGRFQKLLGEYDVQGASVGFDFSADAIEAKGEAIVRGVLARINGQHILGAPPERQPPLRITATLDNADRRQLGLELENIVQGVTTVDIQTIPAPVGAEKKLHVRADLTNAELTLSGASWRKPAGRSAFAEFDIGSGPQGRHELQNFRIAGDNIAVEGWVALNAERKLKEFYFPDFSLNVVTSLKLQGTLQGNNVWAIKARGSTFDGKDFFRSLFTVGREKASEDEGKASVGIDLDAEIDNVLGFSELSLRGLKAKVQTRGGKLTVLDARGTLDGGAPLAAILDHDGKGQRRIRVDSTDAGRTFKLVGFYPNMQNGRVRIEVNADGRGAAEKTGILWVEDFRVLGDPIVSEVVSSGFEDGRPKISGDKRVIREVFEFNVMRVPFSVGHGQFVIDDAYMKGPLLGATIRGKVDYKTEKVSIGGTYIPLQGLNNAFGQIPVLGQILSGPRGEGIFGITFAIQGAMANPQVIVNPLSLVAPGIFREVFQMTNPSPQVQPRAAGANKSKRNSRGSSAPAVAPGTTIDGWSSETTKQ